MSNTYTSVREQVVAAAGTYARQYPSVVDGVTNAITESGSVDAGKDFLRGAGYGTYAYLLDSVSLPTVAQAETSFTPPYVEREVAAEVIRAFLVGEEDMPEEDVTALLVLAGLEDEVVPEPEIETVVSEDTVDPGLFRRLVEFARGKGFRG